MPLAYIIYQNIQSRREKRTRISVDKNYFHFNKLYLFKLKKFTSCFGFVAFFFLLLSTISFSQNFVVCNRYPFGLLVKFKL